jgi:hypothetical protein
MGSRLHYSEHPVQGVEVRTANIRDCLELGPNLRIEDKSEVMAVAGLDPTTGLLQSFTGSNECLTVVLEGDPIAMLGVGHCALGDDIGMIWMLASPKLFEVTQAFIRHSKRFIETLGGPYTILMNYVDCRNTGHIRWLRWCGFTFIAKHDDFGVGKLPFYEFVRI